MNKLYRVPNKDYFKDHSGKKYNIKMIQQVIREGLNLRFSNNGDEDRTLEYLTLIAFNDMSNGQALLHSDNSVFCQFLFKLGDFLGYDKILEIVEDGGSQDHFLKNKHNIERSVNL